MLSWLILARIVINSCRPASQEAAQGRRALNATRALEVGGVTWHSGLTCQGSRLLESHAFRLCVRWVAVAQAVRKTPGRLKCLIADP